MQATKSKEPAQREQAQDAGHSKPRHEDSRRENTRLDDRYGKIGISAVAAAVRHQGERHDPRATRQLGDRQD